MAIDIRFQKIPNELVLPIVPLMSIGEGAGIVWLAAERRLVSKEGPLGPSLLAAFPPFRVLLVIHIPEL